MKRFCAFFVVVLLASPIFGRQLDSGKVVGLTRHPAGLTVELDTGRGYEVSLSDGLQRVLRVGKRVRILQTKKGLQAVGAIE